jgi:catechol 2,3-dioxygenase-like lactoylglutathione lyase family enzyme
VDDKIISGIQQIGIGVVDAAEAFKWYRRTFGLDLPIFDDAAQPVHMVRYTGNVLQSRRAILATSLRGGGGFEIWQYTSRAPSPPDFEPGVGDLGILWPKIKALDVERAHRELTAAGARVQGPVAKDPTGTAHFYVADPWNNRFDVVESASWFAPRAGRAGTSTGGVAGCTIGVSDAGRALPLYRDILGYDTVLSDTKGVFEDLAGLPGGAKRVRRVILGHRAERVGPFSRWLGRTTIELIEPLMGLGRKILAGRFWGDLGFIHLCFDVRGMDGLKGECRERGFQFTVDSADSFDMGEAAGRFAYVEDQDGTLIELVEAHRIPIMKKLGWYLDLGRRNPRKPLPRLMIRALGLSRVKD